MMSFTFSRTPCVLLLVLCLALPAWHTRWLRTCGWKHSNKPGCGAESTQEEEPAEEVADPELGDINLVSRTPRPKMFTFATLQTLNFSSNAFLVPNNVAGRLLLEWRGRRFVRSLCHPGFHPAAHLRPKLVSL